MFQHRHHRASSAPQLASGPLHCKTYCNWFFNSAQTDERLCFYLVTAVPAEIFFCISIQEICDGCVGSSLLSLTSQIKKRRSLSLPRIICHCSIDRPVCSELGSRCRLPLRFINNVVYFSSSFLAPVFKVSVPFARTFNLAKLFQRLPAEIFCVKGALDVYELCCICSCWCENEPRVAAETVQVLAAWSTGGWF